MVQKWPLLLLACALLAPTAALADKKDADKQRRDGWEQRDRVRINTGRDRNGRGDGSGRVWGGNANGRDYPRNSGSGKEWSKDQKELEKDRRQDLKERAKDQRDAMKERDKDRREAAREYDKDRREADREYDKDRREAGKDRRDGTRPNTRLPYPIR